MRDRKKREAWPYQTTCIIIGQLIFINCYSGSQSWMRMKPQCGCSLVSLSSLVCAHLHLSKHLYTNNPVVCNSLKIWMQFRTHFKNRNALLSAPIYGNHLFAPALGGAAFRERYRGGVECVENIFKGGVFMSTTHLENVYGIPSKTNYLRYFQV